MVIDTSPLIEMSKLKMVAQNESVHLVAEGGEDNWSATVDITIKTRWSGHNFDLERSLQASTLSSENHSSIVE